MQHPEPVFELVRMDTGRVQAYQKGYILAPGEKRGAYEYAGGEWKWVPR